MQKFIVVCWQYSRVRFYRVQEYLSGAIVFIAGRSVGDDDRAGASHSAVKAVNMACAFLDSQGVILVDFVLSGYTVNADYYSTLRSDQLCGLPSVESNQICYEKVSYFSTIMLHHTRLVRQ